jgi:hypothetical protein
MLLAMALLGILGLVAIPDLVTYRAFSVIVVNVVLAIGLLGDQPWARTWTLLRAVLGGILFVVIAITQGDYADMLLQGVLTAGLIIVLAGRPHKRRTLVGGVLFAIAFFVMSDLYVLAWLEQFLEDTPAGSSIRSITV